MSDFVAGCYSLLKAMSLQPQGFVTVFPRARKLKECTENQHDFDYHSNMA
jgi:hypothetical protein